MLASHRRNALFTKMLNLEKKAPFQLHSCHFQALALWPRIDFSPLKWGKIYSGSMHFSASLFSPLYVANTFWWQANQSTTTSNNMCIHVHSARQMWNISHYLHVPASILMNSVCLKTLSRKYDMVPASWNDKTTAENTAVIFSQVSVNLMSSHSCTPKSILFTKIPGETWCNGGRRQGGEKGKKVTNPRWSWQGQALRPGMQHILIFSPAAK